MRNLKRALSLTLASVMLLGMMVVGSSAAAGYDDVKETDNVEAIEVLQAIEVMVGDERGFGPERPVNRAEMAVVMGKLLSLDYNYYATSCPFNDVYDWAQGWVGACAANKIVSGRGDGVYDPGATVTAVEAASMLMRALGYFQYTNDYADGFEVSTVRQGTIIGIFDNVGSSATEPMTRNQIAQMVLNALQSSVVEPDGNTTTFLNPDGTVLATTGKVNYVSVTSNKPFASAIGTTKATSVGSQNDGFIVELGERLYNGDLKLYEYTDDDYMRPARTWEYDGKTIGTYMKKENIRAEYTDGVNRRELYDLLGRSSLNDYDFKYYVDGVEDSDITAADILTRTTKDYGTTGRGVLTQVFVDTEAETIDITSINTWLAKATADYNATRESVVLNVYNNYTSNKTTTIAKTVSKTDVAEAENVTKDQYLLVNWSGKDQPANTYEVVEIAPVEILSNSTLTKFSKGSDSDPLSDKTGHEAIFSSVTTNGTEYKNSKKAYYSDEALDLYNNNLLTNKTYNVYLDKYGYAIGVDLYAGDDNYVFISGIKLNNSSIATTRADANAIFTDGTAGTISVNVKDTNKNIETVQKGSLTGKAYFEKFGSSFYDEDTENAVVNRWYTYTVDKDNVYTLTPAARMLTSRVEAAKTIKCDNVVLDRTAATTGDTAPHATAGERIYGNDKSVYIIPELDHVSGKDVTNKVITGVDGLYTGVQNVEIEVGYNATAGSKLVLGSDTTELYDSVYAVYDKNNYVIAAVIVGEAKGTSANYAYILTAAKSEAIIDDTYYWEFDAVIDGVKQTLTVKSKFANTINSLLPGHVQELRYTDEYVTAIKNIGVTKFYTNPAVEINRDVHEVYDVGHVRNYSYPVGTSTRWSECGNTACSFTDYTYPTSARLNALTAPDLHVDGRTLKLGLDDAQDHGLTLVSETTPAVVVQWEDGSKETRYYTSVAAALATLGDADGDETNGKLGFAGRITAVLNSQGVAKWVVFNSDTPVNSKAGTITGSTCEITIIRTLNNGAGVENNLEPIVQKVSTSTLSTRADGTKYWTVAAPVVPGWVPMLSSQTVTYASGTSSYKITFVYSGGSASSDASLTTATATTAGVASATVAVNGSYLDVTINDTRDHFDEGDKITVTAVKANATDSANASIVDGTAVLTYKGGAWVNENDTITVKAEDGTTMVYTPRVVLSSVKTITSAALALGASNAGGATVSGPVAPNARNEIVVVVGGTAATKNDTIEVTPTLTASTSTVSPAKVVLTYGDSSWDTGKFTVTAQDGTTQEYTVKTGASSVAEIDTATAQAVGSITGTLTANGAVDKDAKTVKITLTGTGAADDSIVVKLTAKAGGTVAPASVMLTRGATEWSTATVVVTAADGTTKSDPYTVSVVEAAAPASTSNAALSKNSLAPSAATGLAEETITVSAADGNPFTTGTPSASATSSNGGEDATKIHVTRTDNTTFTVSVDTGLTKGDTYEISIPLTAEDGTSLTALKITLTVGD